MRKIALALLSAALITPAMAQAAEPPCLTAAEFTSLSSYALPSVIKGVAQQCSATLPADAFLRSKGDELSTRYARAKPGAWPGAKAAFLKMSNGTNDQAAQLIRGLPDTTLQPMVDGLIEGMVSQQLRPQRCGTIDRLVRLLAPLPPENTAELIGLAAGLGSHTGTRKVGAISLCPAS